MECSPAHQEVQTDRLTPHFCRAQQGARLAPRREAALPGEAICDARHVRVQNAQVQEAAFSIGASEARGRGRQTDRARRWLRVRQPILCRLRERVRAVNKVRHAVMLTFQKLIEVHAHLHRCKALTWVRSQSKAYLQLQRLSAGISGPEHCKRGANLDGVAQAGPRAVHL